MDVSTCKLIRYPNGTCQLIRYHTPVQTKKSLNPAEKFSFQEEEFLKSKKNTNEYLSKNGKQYILSPFNNEICERINDFETFSKKSTPESNLIHSLNRTKKNIYRYARCAPWEYFVTLTFDSSKTDRYDFTECSRLVRRWFNNQHRNAPDMKYLVVPERHKDGAWHFHALLANVGNMKFTDSGKRSKGKIIYNMSKWSYGFSTATAVTDVYKVANYIGKYITKDLCEATPNKQRYFVSKNMPKPEEFVFYLGGDIRLTSDEEESLKNISDEEIEKFYASKIKEDEEKQFFELLSEVYASTGCEVVHVSQPRNDNSFVDVDYYELQ